jgi:hypothetical protein
MYVLLNSVCGLMLASSSSEHLDKNVGNRLFWHYAVFSRSIIIWNDVITTDSLLDITLCFLPVSVNNVIRSMKIRVKLGIIGINSSDSPAKDKPCAP